MNNTKLISVLTTLGSEEWSSFRKYLLKYTRRGSDNFNFFEFLNQRRDKLHSLQSSEEIRLKYFSKLSSKGFSNMMSRVFNWLEEWLAIHEFKQQQYAEELMLIKAYNRRGLYKLANTKATRLEESILKGETLDIVDNKTLAELFHTQYYSENSIKYNKGGELLEKLCKYFFNQVKEHSLLYLPEFENVQRIQKYDLSKSIDQINEMIDFLPETELSVHLKELILLNRNNESKLLVNLFDKMKTGIFTPNGFMHTLLVYYLISLSLQLWLKGKLSSKDMVGEIYDYAISSGVLLEHKKIAIRRFHNIVSTLSGVNSYDWTKNFIDKYYELVDTPKPESSKALAYAQLCMYHDKYDDINQHIKSVSYNDFDIKMRSYCLQAIALYKDEDLDLDILQNKIGNFKRFLTRNKHRVSQKYYDSNFNFFDVIIQLSNQKYMKASIDLSKYSDLAYRYWINKELSNKT